MSTPTLNPGTFLLFNLNTSRYIAGKSSASSGDAVTTVPTVDDTHTDNTRFFVTLTDGEYTFFNAATNMYLSTGTDQKDGSAILIWRQTPHKWDVSSFGTGLWGANQSGAEYWSDTKDSDDHVVLLVNKAQQGKRIQWQLIAA